MTKQSKRKFFKTVIRLEVISEDPIKSMSIDDILRESDTGDFIAKVTRIVEDKKIDARQTAKEAKHFGSDAEFFRLSDDGSELID